METQERQSQPQDALQVLYFASSCYAACILPFIRRRVGSHAFGFTGVGAMVIIFVAAGFLRDLLLLHYLWIWFVAIACHRVAVFRRWRRGEYVHSRYCGDALFGRLPKMSDRAAKGVVEPLLCAATGITVGIFSDGLGKFLVYGAIAMAIKTLIEVAADDARLRRMRDAQIEQGYLARRFREGD